MINRDDIDDSCITLNGKPAKIIGKKEKFPQVVELHGPLAVTFSWETIQRVIANGGHFKA